MAISSPPSLQHRYTLIWSRDSALARPQDPDALKQWEEAFGIARETGKYQDVLRHGEEPTKFEVKPLAGSVARKLLDDLAARRIGEMGFSSLVFRLCIKAVVNPDLKVDLDKDPRYGEIANEEICDQLDAISPSIVNELGSHLFDRASRPPGK